jgi:hypothetical protein
MVGQHHANEPSAPRSRRAVRATFRARACSAPRGQSHRRLRRRRRPARSARGLETAATDLGGRAINLRPQRPGAQVASRGQRDLRDVRWLSIASSLISRIGSAGRRSNNELISGAQRLLFQLESARPKPRCSHSLRGTIQNTSNSLDRGRARTGSGCCRGRTRPARARGDSASRAVASLDRVDSGGVVQTNLTSVDGGGASMPMPNSPGRGDCAAVGAPGTACGLGISTIEMQDVAIELHRSLRARASTRWLRRLMVNSDKG